MSDAKGADDVHPLRGYIHYTVVSRANRYASRFRLTDVYV